MTLVETLPVRDNCAQWTVWGTVARIVVTDPAAVTAARALVESELAAVDQACSRFRPDSELGRAASSGGRPVRISRLAADLVTVALDAARRTDGDVDPTVGAALCALGYDRDLAAIAGTRIAAAVVVHPAVDWRSVHLDGDVLTVRAGVQLDLGATAKAYAADRCARTVSDRLGVGVLVALGGDIATAGDSPDGGWEVMVRDRPGDPRTVVALPAGAALATSSTASRRWRSGDTWIHHIVDPRTGRPAAPVWRTVSVAAHSCVEANTLTTAALVRGRAAPAWLRGLGAPARFVTPTLSVITLPGWPA